MSDREIDEETTAIKKAIKAAMTGRRRKKKQVEQELDTRNDNA